MIAFSAMAWLGSLLGDLCQPVRVCSGESPTDARDKNLDFLPDDPLDDHDMCFPKKSKNAAVFQVTFDDVMSVHDSSMPTRADSRAQPHLLTCPFETRQTRRSPPRTAALENSSSRTFSRWTTRQGVSADAQDTQPCAMWKT